MYWGTCYSPGYRSASQTRAPARGHTPGSPLRKTPRRRPPACAGNTAPAPRPAPQRHRLAVQPAEERQRRIGPQASLEELPHRHARIDHGSASPSAFTASAWRDVISVAGIAHRREAHPLRRANPTAQLRRGRLVHLRKYRAPRLRGAATAAGIISLAGHGGEKTLAACRWG